MPVDRPDWDDYFMSMAILTASRSLDSQTQYGAVFVRDKKIIATGYNSPPKKMPDSFLPNTRPLKYPWMIHAEANALYNCDVNTLGATCYVNGEPCNDCLKSLYQSDIRKFVILKGKCNLLKQYTEEEMAFRESLIEWGGIKIREIDLGISAFSRALVIANFPAKKSD